MMRLIYLNIAHQIMQQILANYFQLKRTIKPTVLEVMKIKCKNYLIYIYRKSSKSNEEVEMYGYGKKYIKLR